MPSGRSARPGRAQYGAVNCHTVPDRNAHAHDSHNGGQMGCGTSRCVSAATGALVAVLAACGASGPSGEVVRADSLSPSTTTAPLVTTTTGPSSIQRLPTTDETKDENPSTMPTIDPASSQTPPPATVPAQPAEPPPIAALVPLDMAAPSRQLIGTTISVSIYPTQSYIGGFALPPGTENWGGGVVSSSPDLSDIDNDHPIATLRLHFPDGTDTILLVRRIGDIRMSTEATVLAGLDLHVPDGQLATASDCTEDGQMTQSVLALVDLRWNEMLPALQAWRLDGEAEQITGIDPAGIECLLVDPD